MTADPLSPFYRDDAKGRAIARIWYQKADKHLPAIRPSRPYLGYQDLAWLSSRRAGTTRRSSHPWVPPGSGSSCRTRSPLWAHGGSGSCERLDPQRSTDAAIRYLGDLHQLRHWGARRGGLQHGAGGRARHRKFNTNDFWGSRPTRQASLGDHSLRPEDHGARARDDRPAAFGLENVARDVPSEFDVVRVPAGFPLRDIAKAAELPETAVTGINPELLAGRAPPAPPGAAPRTWSLRVPAGTGAVVTRKLAPAQASANVEPYVVRFGDTTAAIAHERGVDERTIRQLNSIGTQERLERGTVPVPRRTEAWCRPSRAWR